MSADPLLGAREIREIAHRLGVRPTKKLGQNFVIDPNTVERIVRAAELPDSARVLEVGPGLGSLTLALLQAGAWVTAIEVDPVLAAELPRTVSAHQPEHAERLRVLTADALRVTDLADDQDALVANLPYNVAVPVLLHLLALLPSLRTALVMVQKEVAERLAARPGSKAYGVPSVKARWFGAVEAAGDVSPRVFWPEPNVESGLVRIRRAPAPSSSVAREQVFAVVDAAFGQRRKVLRSALATVAGSTAAAESALVSAGVDPRARGEVLELHDFVRIAQALAATSTGETA